MELIFVFSLPSSSTRLGQSLQHTFEIRENTVQKLPQSVFSKVTSCSEYITKLVWLIKNPSLVTGHGSVTSRVRHWSAVLGHPLSLDQRYPSSDGDNRGSEACHERLAKRVDCHPFWYFILYLYRPLSPSVVYSQCYANLLRCQVYG
ncbi:hypothetical protein RRG08_053222 [Elysia crispata]|uniref:Uncharacterized protein n=1 Tax=Elysia crispata TaxID=231223 RepID=A0AAE1ANC4_9GAST|nr:hypothetical protein RRG08_053222 [Elysia crispata]